jgi:hypothetical protein
MKRQYQYICNTLVFFQAFILTTDWPHTKYGRHYWQP